MKVTMPEVMHGLERMLEIYPRPRHAPAETVEFAKMWFRELSDLDAEAFRAGVSTYCKTDARYFPTPGEIRKLGDSVRPSANGGMGLAAEYDRWEREWADAPLGKPVPCPVCAGVDTWSNGGPHTVRRGVVHDEAKHAAAGITFVDTAHQHQLPMVGKPARAGA